MDPKERILSKAHELFNRLGFKRVTMDEIALKTGMSKKTIYQTFSTKDEIVSAVVEDLIAKSVSTCEKNAATSENAVHEIFSNIEMVKEMMSEMNPVLYEDLEKFFPSVFEKFFKYKHNYIYKKVKENLEKGIKEGMFRAELNIDVIAKFRVETSSISFNQDIFPFEKYNLAEVEIQMIELYLYGICTSKGHDYIKKYKQQRIKNQLYA